MIGSDGHRLELRVYFEDTDAGGIVYHARFLAFAERGRTEALRALQVPHQELVERLGLLFVVRRIKVDYLTPARLDERLCVVTRTIAVGAASVTLDQAITGVDADGAVVVRARLDVLLACVRLADNRPSRVPPRWRTALTGLLAVAE